MAIRRRQVLYGLSVLGGMSLSACIHQAVTPRSQPADSPDRVAPTPTPSPSLDPTLLQAGLIDPPRADVRLVVISDINGPYGATTYDAEVHRAIALIPAWKPDLVISGGDMIAGQDRTLTPAKIEAMWAGFDEAIAAPLRRAGLPFGFTIGNHDASRAVGARGWLYAQERDMAAAYWNNPAHDPGLSFLDRAKFPFYYTFRQGEVFFLVWDASSGLAMPADDRAWVEASLASEAAQSARLRLVIGHLPLYAVAVNRDKVGEVMDDADQWRSLLERYRVHTYISGHHHAYYPGHRGRLDMLHAGAMGSGPRQLLVGGAPPRKTVTLVDIAIDTATTVYTTFDMQAMTLVDQHTLPRLIVGHNGMVLRRDVEWADLTPQEQALCRDRHSLAQCQS